MIELPVEYISKSEEETASIADNFSKEIESGSLIALVGELGSGKTFFVKKLAKILGFDGYVSSPTFTILNIYEGELPIFHFDFYRLKDQVDIENIGFYDLIREDGIFLVEWPEKARSLFPEWYYQITFDILGKDTRNIKIEIIK
ncbi:MAG TPA: tRNA (adenosine(37)-N6)-threonylcarbamoyltransferase complex ATPase subunit type 1 TsaE [Candidatus Cloacimonetes bacterium]|nr:tRNA (adenosine(37)-N6)-threonylcarbamoyltransferase complex ATPase subunit type 1 TsaE [Candidatus Cloacimonadota bacterium]HEX37356.1 tRNA (adenosine(37)-N6)-threonylcarbamoyltransferase complex ATPase subunit type 1 TsaE [Candidatus Cloacimonadota bacterium]